MRRAHHFDPDAQTNGGHVTGRVRVRRLCPPYELEMTANAKSLSRRDGSTEALIRSIAVDEIGNGIDGLCLYAEVTVRSFGLAGG